MAKWVTFDTSATATGSITIVDKGSNTTDINQLHGINGFTITSTDGTAKEYIFDKNNALGETGTINAEGIVIQVYTFSAASDTASEVMEAIRHDNGHNGKIICSLTDNIVSLTQVDKGSDGNNTIAPGSTPTPSYISYTGLSGGISDKSYTYSIKNIHSLFLDSSTVIKCYARNPNQPYESVSDDIITITCSADTAESVYTELLKKISEDKRTVININAFDNLNISSITYATGS